jgi:acylpyruvate hydrolase
MKLVTFIRQGKERTGAIGDSGHIIDLVSAYRLYLREVEGNRHGQELAPILLGQDMCDFLGRGEQSWAAARKAIEYVQNDPAAGDESGIVLNEAQIRLKAPVPRPGAVISEGKNFSDHVAEMSAKKGPSYPVAFLKLPGTVIGPEDEIPYPRETEKLDYEVELAVVIGKPCIGVSKEDALDYVAGYTVFNDISARDVIRSENKNGIHLMGKSFPGFAPMGPYLVTTDEIPEPQNLKVQLWVNDELRQDSNLGYMIFNIRKMIAYWSQMGLKPGDVLTTGTPRGVAAGRKEGETPWWLKPGDVVEAEVEKVGRLRNRIVRE